MLANRSAQHDLRSSFPRDPLTASTHPGRRGGMMISSTLSPAHGSDLNPCREIVTVRICAGRGRAHRHLIRFSRTNAHNPVRNQSAAVFPTSGGVIAAFLPRLRRLAARTLERFVPLVCARALAAIFSRIRRDIRPGLLNFCRPLVAAGKPSFFCSLLKHRQEPRSGIFNAFTLAPVLSPVPVLHASNRHQKDTRDHGKSYAQHG